MSKKVKKINAIVKLQLPAGEATPQPPVGPVLGQHGINLGEFVKQYNDKTAKSKGTIIPVEITIYADRSFDFILKTPPASVLIREAAGIDKGSPVPNKQKVAKLTQAQVKEIAERKFADLSATDIAGAMKIIEGTARSMGVTTES